MLTVKEAVRLKKEVFGLSWSVGVLKHWKGTGRLEELRVWLVNKQKCGCWRSLRQKNLWLAWRSHSGRKTEGSSDCLQPWRIVSDLGSGCSSKCTRMRTLKCLHRHLTFTYRNFDIMHSILYLNGIYFAQYPTANFCIYKATVIEGAVQPHEEEETREAWENQGLKEELEKKSGVKATMVSVSIVALGAVTLKLGERLQHLGSCSEVHGTTKILRRTLKLAGLW